MILRRFNFLFVVLYCRSVLSNNFKNIDPNILKYLEEHKKIISPYGGAFELEDKLNLSQEIFDYNQIIEQENIHGNFKENSLIETVEFYLFTRNFHNGLKYEVMNLVNVSTITTSHVKARKTYYLIHGFSGDELDDWIVTLKDKLLQKEDCNVISVSWPSGTIFIPHTYETAMKNVPYVGKVTAILTESLASHVGLTLESVHCIGHSLGAHVCGFFGKPFMGKLGRISGLDPAGPFYYDLDSRKRLDKSDAIYVDVIHTDNCALFCFGLDEQIGHSDFYPNGGINQPSCVNPQKGLKFNWGCDHEMAYMYYIASLDFSQATSHFLARPCESWLKYKDGNCPCEKNHQYMGFNVNTTLHGSFYLETLANPPYAKEDKDCFRPPLSNTLLTNTLLTINYVIVIEIVGVLVMAFIILIYMKIKRVCFSSKRNEEEDPLMSNRKESNYIGV